MYRNHTNGFFAHRARRSCSTYPINKLAYDGAIFVPIAVPLFCRKWVSPNLKMLQLRIRPTNFKIISITLIDRPRDRKKYLQSSIPPSCGMFVYKLLTSQVANIVPGGSVCCSLIWSIFQKIIIIFHV